MNKQNLSMTVLQHSVPFFRSAEDGERYRSAAGSGVRSQQPVCLLQESCDVRVVQ